MGRAGERAADGAGLAADAWRTGGGRVPDFFLAVQNVSEAPVRLCTTSGHRISVA